MKGWAAVDLQCERIARLLTPMDRKALKIQLPEEAAARHDLSREKELQTLCEQELRRRGIEFLHLSPKAREKAGWPDLTFCIDGRPMAVELKTKRGKLSSQQKHILARLAANGWHTYVVRSFEEFRNSITTDTPNAPMP